MSNQMSFFPTLSAISSPALESGATLCDKPDGRMTDLSGQDHAHASLSHRLAKEKGLLTHDTSGQLGNGSSGTVNLSRFLVNKLRIRAVLLGSTLYKLTLKIRVTPLGRRIYALRASGRRTNGNDYTFWATTTKTDSRGPEDVQRKRTRDMKNGLTLNDLAAMALAPQPTPTAHPANGTPEAFLERKRKAVAQGSKMGISLTDIQMVAQLALPMDGGASVTGYRTKTGNIGQLNPALSRWLMGLPPVFCECAVTAMRLLLR